LNLNKRYLTVTDLLTDDDFLAWQLKKRAGDGGVWADWMAENPDNAELVEEAVVLLAALVSIREKKLPDYQINASFERLLKKIKAKENTLYFIL